MTTSQTVLSEHDGKSSVSAADIVTFDTAIYCTIPIILSPPVRVARAPLVYPVQCAVWVIGEAVSPLHAAAGNRTRVIKIIYTTCVFYIVYTRVRTARSGTMVLVLRGTARVLLFIRRLSRPPPLAGGVLENDKIFWVCDRVNYLHRTTVNTRTHSCTPTINDHHYYIVATPSRFDAIRTRDGGCRFYTGVKVLKNRLTWCIWILDSERSPVRLQWCLCLFC